MLNIASNSNEWVFNIFLDLKTKSKQFYEVVKQKINILKYTKNKKKHHWF